MKLRLFWYQVRGSGLHHLYDPGRRQTGCGIDASPTEIGRCIHTSTPSERCPTCKKLARP